MLDTNTITFEAPESKLEHGKETKDSPQFQQHVQLIISLVVETARVRKQHACHRC